MRSYTRRMAPLLALCLLGILGTSGMALAAAPAITGISPNNGPDTGSTSVTITGTGFIASSTVKFGGAAGTGVTIHSAESITATSPAGSGSELVNVTVTNSNGTSTRVPKDQFAYDPAPASPWLGLDGNSNGVKPERLGEFVANNVVYDRGGDPGIELEAGELLEEDGKATQGGEAIATSIDAGMIPDIMISYKGYEGDYKSDPNFPTEEKGSKTLKEYVEGFVKSAKAVHEKYPSAIFEPINEPWGYTTPQYNGAEYANVIAKLLPEARAVGIPLSSIYVAALSEGCAKAGECSTNKWIPAMYAAQPKLETEIQGWYFHPYGKPSGLGEYDNGGIQALPIVQAVMTSGQNNLIVSEVGYCDYELNKEECGEESSISGTGAQTGKWMTEMLDNAQPYHEAGWLRALIVYARSDGGWRTQLEDGVLTKDGESLDAFGDLHGGRWSIQETPSPKEAKSSSLSSVSCASSESCTAVGHYVNSSSAEATLAERLSGKTWVAQEPKMPAGAKSSGLSGVSCSSSEACIAVGHYVNSSSVEVPLAEKWAGTEWTIKEPKVPAGAKSSGLSGVSCSSSEACIAVGHYVNSSSVEVPLAEKWAGTEWTIKEPKVPAGAKSSGLSGVSCSSSEACIAVGHYVNSSSVEVPLAEKWAGSEWTIEEPKTPTGAKNSSLVEGSCTSSEACTAVGHDINSSSVEVTLAERWNGKEWSIQETKTPTGAKSSSLAGVSCTSSEACTAVGYNSSSTEAALAEHWNGKEWSIQTTATPNEAKSSSLSGVSCRSGETCNGTGHYANGSAVEMALAESYTLHAPYVKTEPATSVKVTEAILQGIVNPEGQETTYHFEYGKTGSYGTSVPVPSGNVGSSTSDLEESKTIAGLEAGTTYHFRLVATNGTGTAYGKDETLTTPAIWSVQEPPAPTGAEESYLEGVSCVSSTACTAVGYFLNSSKKGMPLAEGWNGTAWFVEEPPLPTGAKESYLNGVSCISSATCTAVGAFLNSSGKEVPLAESWNGTAWSVQEPPVPTGAKESNLGGVSCTSSASCTAVGYFLNSSEKRVPLAESWNGTAWSIQEPPIPAGADESKPESRLSSVSCTSSTACTAVGFFLNMTSGDYVPLAERWNGTVWSAQEPPKPVGLIDELDSVSCTSSTLCIAVGFAVSSKRALLTERWNGTEWSIQELPSPTGALATTLESGSCISSTMCSAVGYFVNGSEKEALLAEGWNGTEWSAQEPSAPTGARENKLVLKSIDLDGVSCVSSTACMGVGYFVNSSDSVAMLAEDYH